MENLKKTEKGLLIRDNGLVMFGILDEISINDTFKDKKTRDDVPSGLQLRFISTGKVNKLIGGVQRLVNKKYFTNLSLRGKTSTETNENIKKFSVLEKSELYIPIKNEKTESSFSFDPNTVVVLDDTMAKDGGFYVKEHGCYLSGKLNNVDTESIFDRSYGEFRDKLVLKFFSKITLDRKISSQNHTVENTKIDKFYLDVESDEHLLEMFDKFQELEGKDLLLTVLNDTEKVTYSFDKNNVYTIGSKKQ